MGNVDIANKVIMHLIYKKINKEDLPENDVVSTYNKNLNYKTKYVNTLDILKDLKIDEQINIGEKFKIKKAFGGERREIRFDFTNKILINFYVYFISIKILKTLKDNLRITQKYLDEITNTQQKSTIIQIFSAINTLLKNN